MFVPLSTKTQTNKLNKELLMNRSKNLLLMMFVAIAILWAGCEQQVNNEDNLPPPQ